MFRRLAIIALIVLIFGAAVATYTVRFNERAVVTTFGRADESSVITEPGLHLKIPYAQNVTKYDARLRFIQSDQETQMTQDGAQVVASSYMTWRIEDPLKFYRRFSSAGDTAREHYTDAERLVKSKLRSAMSEVSKFRLDQLVSATDQASKIPELEKQLLARVGQGSEGNAALADYGITPVSVGVSGVLLPQETTKSVFERMKASRLKIANEIKTQGTSQAGTVRVTADSDAKRIASFADQLARTIRTQGDIEAAAFLKQLNEEPRLAVFVQNMEFMRQAYGKTTTFVFPTSLPGFEMFRPDALRNVSGDQIPGPDMSGLLRKPTSLAPSPGPNGSVGVPVQIAAPSSTTGKEGP